MGIKERMFTMLLWTVKTLNGVSREVIRQAVRKADVEMWIVKVVLYEGEETVFGQQNEMIVLLAWNLVYTLHKGSVLSSLLIAAVKEVSMLAVSSGKRNVTVWHPPVHLSVLSAYLP